MLWSRDTLIWHRCSALLCCSCAGGSLLLSLEKVYDIKEAPDIDFTACIHVWDCALMTVGCPTHIFSSNRHYFTHISLFICPFPEPWHRNLSLSDCFKGGESKMKLLHIFLGVLASAAEKPCIWMVVGFVGWFSSLSFHFPFGKSHTVSLREIPDCL